MGEYLSANLAKFLATKGLHAHFGGNFNVTTGYLATALLVNKKGRALSYKRVRKALYNNVYAKPMHIAHLMTKVNSSISKGIRSTY